MVCECTVPDYPQLTDERPQPQPQSCGVCMGEATFLCLCFILGFASSFKGSAVGQTVL